MAGEKFTPYALTALPPVSERDVNGIYFIRTTTGMKVYAISNTINKTPVELDFVDLDNNQTINGRKIFEEPIGVGGADSGSVGVPNVVNKIFMQRYDTNLLFSIFHQGTVGLPRFKTFEFDFSESTYPGSIFTIPQITKSTNVKTYMGHRREYVFTSKHTFLARQYTWNIGNLFGISNMYNELISLIDKGANWDIVWIREDSTTNLRRVMSFKDLYHLSAVPRTQTTQYDPLYLQINNVSGASSLALRGYTDYEIVIPAGAKLIFY